VVLVDSVEEEVSEEEEAHEEDFALGDTVEVFVDVVVEPEAEVEVEEEDFAEDVGAGDEEHPG